MTAPPDTDPAFVAGASVEVNDASVWFGQKVALSELSCSFGPGVTGLLGPNGAGKSTLMRAITGLIGVNAGRVRVEGRDPRTDRDVHRRIALVPEDEAVPSQLTARELVRYVADLHGVRDPRAADAALELVDMLPAADRRLRGFSKGMRQRAKVAAALVTDPPVLVLDEPLNGADPVQRVHLTELFQRLGAALLDVGTVAGVSVTDAGLVVTTDRARDLAVAVAPVARKLGVRLREVRPLDDSLESLFR
ncbi:MAG: ABC transporter ATP-binding protein, partial [Acidimicrobiales bacterium]|nr:ABC transporter ATP-binding protein [Acidimicrobiales bacterium]